MREPRYSESEGENATELSPMGIAALSYATELAWRVFPLHEIVNGRCSCQTKCGSPGKHPRIGDWDERATTDEAQIREWWARWPTANIGIATGPESGLWVLDLDAKRSVDVDGVLVPEGEHSLRRLELQHGPLPDVPVVESPSGGRHLFFKYPSSGQWGNRSAVRPSIDIRGYHGYVVGAPSVGVSGHRYRWLSEERLPAVEPPGWLLTVSVEEGKKPWLPNPQEKIREGEGRHEWMFKYASSRRGVHGDDYDEILAALVVKNPRVCDPPLPLHDLEHIAQSVVTRYEKNQAPPEFQFEIPERLKRRLEGEPDGPPAIPEGMDLAIRLADIFADPPPRPDELVQGMLLQGQGAILASRPNAGKSWVALDLALAVATGLPFLGRATVPKPVVYVDEEAGLWSDYNRLRMLVAGRGIDPEALDRVPLWLAIKNRIKLDTPEGMTAAARMIDRYRPGLVIFDSLVRVSSGDENSNREMAEFFARGADRLMETYGTTILFLHHTRKRGPEDKGDDPFDWMRGASDLQGWPQTTYVLKTTEDRLAPELWNTKQRDIRVEEPYRLRIEIGEDGAATRIFRLDRVVPVQDGVEAKQNKVVEAVQKIEAGGNQATVKRVAILTGLGEDGARKALRDLVTAGRLTEYLGDREPGATGGRPIAYRVV